MGKGLRYWINFYSLPDKDRDKTVTFRDLDEMWSNVDAAQAYARWMKAFREIDKMTQNRVYRDSRGRFIPKSDIASMASEAKKLGMLIHVKERLVDGKWEQDVTFTKKSETTRCSD